MRCLILLLSLALASCSSLSTSTSPVIPGTVSSGPAALTLRSNAAFLPAGSAVRLDCRVPQREQHRALLLAVDGPRTRASVEALDGAAAPITHTLTVDRLTCGTYTLSCTLFGAGDQVLTVKTQALVVTGGLTCPE